jgi:hypothetical protein
MFLDCDVVTRFNQLQRHTAQCMKAESLQNFFIFYFIFNKVTIFIDKINHSGDICSLVTIS